MKKVLRVFLFFPICLFAGFLQCPYGCGGLNDPDVLAIRSLAAKALKQAELLEKNLFYSSGLTKSEIVTGSFSESIESPFDSVEWSTIKYGGFESYRKFSRPSFRNRKYFYLKDYLNFSDFMIRLEEDTELIYKNEVPNFESRIAYKEGRIARLEAKEHGGIPINDVQLGEFRKDVKHLLKRIEQEKSIFSKRLQVLSELKRDSEKIYSEMFHGCIKEHGFIGAYYQRGLLYFDRGDFYEALIDLKTCISKIEDREAFSEELDFLEGECLLELGQYHDAIKALTTVVERNPNHKDAYFERALAYFESGNFDLAIEDFLCSDSKISLSHGLWAISSHPVKTSKEIVSACQNLVEFLSYHSKLEVLEAVIPEIKKIRDPELNQNQKAEVVGYLIGKYGVEVFAPLGATKVYKELMQANRLLTLKQLATTSQKAELLEVTSNWNKAHLDSIEKFKLAKEDLKPFKGKFFTETEARKILHQAGFETFQRPNGIPSNFRIKLSDSGGGLKYVHPEHPYESIRVMPGTPHSPNPAQRKPYVSHHTQDGLAYDKNGKKVSQKSVEAHIPLEDFLYRME
jgi:tetratricopeptide (TPR) repeat protein